MIEIFYYYILIGGVFATLFLLLLYAVKYHGDTIINAMGKDDHDAAWFIDKMQMVEDDQIFSICISIVIEWPVLPFRNANK